MFFVWLVLLVSLVFPATAGAKPRVSQLEDVLNESTTIVIATFPAKKPDPSGRYTLLVERSLRGDAKPGALAVEAWGGNPRSAAGARVVAFINQYGGWAAYASALAGQTLEDGVLRIEGFNDLNAHFVQDP